ncbi:MAG: alpha-hydroxy-acid oxidizing protein [Clostridiaceae bacterium]|nr:alpha-hydroxy-acid oxidizing protein [Clostridiaceae bacterium]
MNQNNKQEMKAGDSNRITREYFDSLLIEMRHMDAVIPSTEIELYGELFSTPIMTAALSHLENCRTDGAVGMAKGALAANTLMWTGMGEDEELEKISATGAKVVKIIKPHSDNSVIFKKIEIAEKLGVTALGMDIDHAFNNKGQYDNVLGLPMSPKTFDEIKSFIEATKLPFIIKGVLSVQDALKCVEAGARGIVVSHHHGIMDYALPPLMILPDIVKAVDQRMPVFVDCGIASGYDAFKALALGASAVCVGRALMGPLAEEGAEGVHRKITELTQELSGVMARTCSADIHHIDPSLIRRL